MVGDGFELNVLARDIAMRIERHFHIVRLSGEVYDRQEGRNTDVKDHRNTRHHCIHG